MIASSKPKLLDLFCKAGGATKGYQRAGFYVTGVDNEPQPHYCGDEFYQDDAFDFLVQHGHEYDVIHASPVCKGYSSLMALSSHLTGKKYPNQIADVRELLVDSGKPYIIENVEGAPLFNYVMLCGSMFGLQIYRHRLFECYPKIVMAPASCNHKWRASGNAPRKGEHRKAGNLTEWNVLTVTGHDFILADARIAMGIDWMNQAEISQAIPPAYTEFIGATMLKIINL